MNRLIRALLLALTASLLALPLTTAAPAEAFGGKCRTVHTKISGHVVTSSYTCRGWKGLRAGARVYDGYYWHTYQDRTQQSHPFRLRARVQDTAADGVCANLWVFFRHTDWVDKERQIGYVCGKGETKYMSADIQPWFFRNGEIQIAICQGKGLSRCSVQESYKAR